MKFLMGLASRTIRVLQAGEMPEDVPGHGESFAPKGTCSRQGVDITFKSLLRRSPLRVRPGYQALRLEGLVLTGLPMTKGDQPHTGTRAGTQVPAHFVPKVDTWYRTRHRLAGTGGPNPVYRRYMTCFTSGPTTSLTRSWPDRTVHDLPTKQVMGRLQIHDLLTNSSRS
ncbi:hypothetical protein PCASD_22934 [Puccinia coronata f. sp. avenae]|uniref:Uncharacterized protein n=1 Tax=Puccinia coronata f. sp. avenae TaxID=200324 RepID=A0A2N5RZ93_9BASI|nr:hypothetical protein PCASD_22934 [Puccinia coronata f. sp. avenae]